MCPKPCTECTIFFCKPMLCSIRTSVNVFGFLFIVSIQVMRKSNSYERFFVGILYLNLRRNCIVELISTHYFRLNIFCLFKHFSYATAFINIGNIVTLK
jgi:hypothetical protein